MKFRSRVSVLMSLFVFCALVVPSVVHIDSDGVLPLLFCLVLALFVMSLLFFIRYTIEDDKLYVTTLFFFKQQYDLKKLESITPTRSLLSAPAASLHRIKLDFGCGQALIISPAMQDVFIDEVKRVNPKVVINM